VCQSIGSFTVKGGGHQTIGLIADTLYRAKIGSQHFGLYIDERGEIHYFTKTSFSGTGPAISRLREGR
jgi:hypothetical protein